MRPEESRTPVIEEESQCTGDRREGNLIPGDIFFFKETAFKRFRSRGKVRGIQIREIEEMNLIRERNIYYGK